MLSILNSVRKRDEPVPVDGPVPAAPARTLILGRCAPAGLRVHGHLDLSNSPNLVELPDRLAVTSLDLSGCTALRALPYDLRVRRLILNGCTALQALPAGLHVYELQMQYTRVRSLPPDLCVEYRLDLEGCAELRSLPAGLKTGSLILRNCIALESLPEGLDVYFLDITGCTGLRGWPHTASVRIGRLNASGCAGLHTLPPWLTTLAQLDISGCANLNALPEGLRVSSWIDLANTGITSLPASLQGVRLRWRGVPIDARIAFQPETITIREVLGEPNAELRRVLLERMGYDAFLSQAQAQVLDRDRDPGGERRLLRVPLPEDEPLVCLCVVCPSTGRQYVLRVPPTMRSCRQAAAWIAGYDNPGDYHPLAET
jgi:hypothetical protein